MRKDYFHWLVSLLGDDYLRDNYQRLLWKLFSTEFTWTVPYDENRAKDGLYLRHIFSQELDVDFDMDCACTVLEMMLALARRCEDQLTYDPRLGDRTSYWFWAMLENSGLDICDDFGYIEGSVQRILCVVLERRYGCKGEGGLFYARKTTHDFRDIDLWWQLNLWLNEHIMCEKP